MRILIVDNLDSFTYNIAHLFGEKGVCDLTIVRTDEATFEDIDFSNFDGVIISPGPGNPGNPRDFRLSGEVIARSELPILGVCLGHQGIARHYGAAVERARTPMHGRLSNINHTGKGLFRGLPNPISVVRYHSLIVNNPVPDPLKVCAWTDGGEVMAIEHQTAPIVGLQFHPESISSFGGATIAENFVDLIASTHL